ncbi:hypothetical protein KAR48_11900 [bacterium]|nr:hypothetical protein [bacterium]
MALVFDKMHVIIEGKTKIIYENPDDPKTVFMKFKDDITAGDGVKHDVIQGKALVDWKTNKDIFEYLNRKGIHTHYVESPQECVSIVRKLDYKIDLEVVTRRVAAGSILKWGTAVEGQRFDPLITQFHYKDDPLHDPMLDAAYVEFIISSKQDGHWFKEMREINIDVFQELETAFKQCRIQLIDFKLEYGLIDGKVTLIDEISGGSFRLWPYAKENPDFNQPNILSELDPKGRLDKDNYRLGESLDQVQTKFEQIANLTDTFKDLS